MYIETLNTGMYIYIYIHIHTSTLSGMQDKIDGTISGADTCNFPLEYCFLVVAMVPSMEYENVILLCLVSL